MTCALGKAQRREESWRDVWAGWKEEEYHRLLMMGFLTLVLAFKERTEEHTSSVHGRHDLALGGLYLLWLMIIYLLWRGKHLNPNVMLACVTHVWSLVTLHLPAEASAGDS